MRFAWQRQVAFFKQRTVRPIGARSSLRRIDCQMLALAAAEVNAGRLMSITASYSTSTSPLAPSAWSNYDESAAHIVVQKRGGVTAAMADPDAFSLTECSCEVGCVRGAPRVTQCYDEQARVAGFACFRVTHGCGLSPWSTWTSSPNLKEAVIGRTSASRRAARIFSRFCFPL